MMLPSRWYVIESYRDATATTHRPKILVTSEVSLPCYSRHSLSRATPYRPVCWRVVSSWDTRDEAEEARQVWWGLRALERPDLFGPRRSSKPKKPAPPPPADPGPFFAVLSVSPTARPSWSPSCDWCRDGYSPAPSVLCADCWCDHRADLEERAAIAEYQGGLSRAAAEVLAWGERRAA